MEKKFIRPVFSTNPDNSICASDLSHEDSLRASDLHYLVIPRKEVKRLRELTLDEQKSIFVYMEELANKTIKTKGINYLTISLNDGALACQGAGHMHMHIVGFKETESFNLEEKLNDTLKKFGKPPLDYIEKIKLHCRISELGEKIDQALKNYSDENYGFSLLSEYVFNNPSEPQNFLLQIFSQEHRRSYSITQIIRVIKGLRNELVAWTGENKDAVYTFIEKD